MADMRVLVGTLVPPPQANHDQRRAAYQPKQAGQRARHAAKFHADRHRQIDDVATRQKLAESQQLSEFVTVEPLVSLDDLTARKRQRTSESREAKRQETNENFRYGGRCQRGLQDVFVHDCAARLLLSNAKRTAE